jgi:ubiquinone/menaquinone biosynthesis C-methylase UbiE
MRATVEELQRVADLRQKYGSLEAFLQPLEPYFSFFPSFKTRLFKALAAAPINNSLQSLEENGVLPNLDPSDFGKIVKLWDSDLFRVYLGSIGFAPSPETKLADALKPPVKQVEEFSRRCDQVEALYGIKDHWECVLQKTCPELYLLPYLSDDAREGCDLACGWGRGALTVLLRSRAAKIHCCDSSTESLELLQTLAARNGLENQVVPHTCQLPNLPLEENSQDFAIGFDIFELLPDGVLHPFLDEILRVCKPSAVLYFKITLHAFQPTLGQVQNFTLRRVRTLFEGRSVDGKSMRLELHHRQAPEHFMFRVIATPRDESPSAVRRPAESRAARLSKLRRK